MSRRGMMCILFGGPVRSITLPDGETLQYELHPIHGPIVLNGKGDPARKQPGERHAFWKAFEGVPPETA